MHLFMRVPAQAAQHDKGAAFTGVEVRGHGTA